MINKITKKIFRRKAEPTELLAIILGFVVGIGSLLINLGFLSISEIGAETSAIKTVALTFSISLILLSSIYLYRKNKNSIQMYMILVLSTLILLNAYSGAFLTTVFNPTGELGNLPLTIQECKDLGGITIPISMDCPIYTNEVGGNVNFVCCLQDTCQGVWERVYNPETKVFEKMCIE